MRSNQSKWPFRRAIVYLGYNASGLTWNNACVSRKFDIQKFYKEIGFNNPENAERFKRFFSPVV